MIKKLFQNEKIKNFFNILMIPSIRILPGTIAYFLVMSLVPIVTIIAIICSKFQLTTGDFNPIFSVLLPSGVENMLLSIFSGVDDSKFSFWFIILGFILASNGAYSIILASNTLYNVEDSSSLTRRIKSFFLTVILMSLIVFIIFVLGFGNLILNIVLSLDLFSKVSEVVYDVFVIFKWPIAIIIIFYLIKVIYTMAPDKHIPSKYMNKGAIFATGGFIISTAIYSYYVNNIADYSYMYGNLSNIIILMILVYVISYILVIGIAINANIYELNKKD